MLLDEHQIGDLGIGIADQELLLRARDAMRAGQPLSFTAVSSTEHIEILNGPAGAKGAGVRGREPGGWASAVCQWYTMCSGMHSARFVLRHRQGRSHQVQGLCIGVCVSDWDPRVDVNGDRVPEASWMYRVRDGACLEGKLTDTDWNRGSHKKWCVSLAAFDMHCQSLGWSRCLGHFWECPPAVASVETNRRGLVRLESQSITTQPISVMPVRRLARKSITLTLDADAETLSVKTDDVDHGIMVAGVYGGKGGLRWCVSCYHVEDEVTIERVAVDLAMSTADAESAGRASRVSTSQYTHYDTLERQASPAFE